MDVSGQDWLVSNAAKVLDTMVDAIIAIDADGRVLTVNQATEHMFGYDAAELVGQPVTVLMPGPAPGFTSAVRGTLSDRTYASHHRHR